jgi:integrase
MTSPLLGAFSIAPNVFKGSAPWRKHSLLLLRGGICANRHLAPGQDQAPVELAATVAPGRRLGPSTEPYTLLRRSTSPFFYFKLASWKHYKSTGKKTKTGMRCGEVLALTWDTIDFQADTIDIR